MVYKLFVFIMLCSAHIIGTMDVDLGYEPDSARRVQLKKHSNTGQNKKCNKKAIELHNHLLNQQGRAFDYQRLVANICRVGAVGGLVALTYCSSNQNVCSNDIKDRTFEMTFGSFIGVLAAMN